ncbi:zinc-ribbon domain-containing protein [Bifidobacterium sp. LC6]|uniref:Zinc-ribbon domain-containing protein n=1 Tax=Bifidobacterium colobi TaxID=2809026 RepID=A0ABS5UWJ3_9BIFI|nr:zinc ribbon domain-containing protein [Bifidobacterium colobi]MBT1174964.1 zinc-ribbon domain-containing protein [Bifidobacterium colobi]
MRKNKERTGAMFCHKCGAQAVPGQQFCPQCGTKLVAAEVGAMPLASAQVPSAQVPSAQVASAQSLQSSVLSQISPQSSTPQSPGSGPFVQQAVGSSAAGAQPGAMPNSAPSVAAVATAATAKSSGWNSLDKNTRLVVIAAACVVVLAFCVFFYLRVSHRSFQGAIDSCQSQFDSEHWNLNVNEDPSMFEISDGGKTLTAEITDYNADIATCVFDKLGMPDSVHAKMSKTRALDGTLTDSWGGIKATWMYDGETMSVVLER